MGGQVPREHGQGDGVPQRSDDAWYGHGMDDLMFLFALQHDKVRRRKAARDEHAASVSAAAGGDGSGSCSGHGDGSGGDGGGA